MKSRRLASVLGFVSCACSWSRFDDVTTDTPVVVLERPSEIRSGFGTSLSSLSAGDRGLLLVHGATGRAQAALFDLGAGEGPNTNALSAGVCSNDLGSCFLASSSAPLPRVVGPSREDILNCFAVGVGKKGDLEPGVVIECAEREVFTIDVPDAYREVLVRAIDLRLPESVAVAFASDDAEYPAIVAASAPEQLAWYYAGADQQPLELVPGEHQPESFGETVAIARIDDRKLVIVGAPELSELHLFAVEADLDPVYRGCIAGNGTDFGRALAVGPLSPDDDSPELAVSDASVVSVLDLAQLIDFDGSLAAGCTSLADLPGRLLYGSVSCKETGAVSGCDLGDFGVSTAIGDVDGDGDGELMVGAPGMRARDTSTAGAVAYFDLDDSEDTTLADLKFIASAKSGDFLGSSLVAARVGSRHVVAAGVPGSGRTALFYCPQFLPASLGGGRCD